MAADEDFDQLDFGEILQHDFNDFSDDRSNDAARIFDIKRYGATVIRKRRRSQLPYIPPVVKHDVRRFYSRMLNNVLNAHDTSLLKSFLETYSSVDDLVFSMEVDLGTRKSGRRYNPAFYYLDGLHEILNFYGVRNSCFFDDCAKITQAVVKTRSDTDRSEIHYTSVAKMALVFDVDLFAVHEDMLRCVDGAACLGLSTLPDKSAVSSLSSSASASLGASTSSDSEDRAVMKVLRRHQPIGPLQYPDLFEFYNMRHGRPISRQAQPLEVTLSFDVVVTVNERRQIERMHSGKAQVVSIGPLR